MMLLLGSITLLRLVLRARGSYILHLTDAVTFCGLLVQID